MQPQNDEEVESNDEVEDNNEEELMTTTYLTPVDIQMECLGVDSGSLIFTCFAIKVDDNRKQKDKAYTRLLTLQGILQDVVYLPPGDDTLLSMLPFEHYILRFMILV